MINNFNKKATKKAFFCCKNTVYQTKEGKKVKKERDKKHRYRGEKESKQEKR